MPSLTASRRAGGGAVLSASASAELAETTRPVSVTMDAPSPLSAGDVMFALVFSIEPTVTSPSGWTRAAANSGSGDYRFVLDWKIATASDVGDDYTWTVDDGTGETEVMVEIVAVSGIGSSPIAGAVGFDGGSSVSSVSPSATLGSGASAILTLGASSETLPASAADHSISGVTRSAFVDADSSNLHMALSAFLDLSSTTAPTLAFGTTVLEGGAYAIPIGFGGAGVEVRKAGSTVGTRPAINFIEGTNVTLTVADDSSNDEVDVTIAATSGGAGALAFIGQVEVGAGGAASVSFSSIPAGYESLQLIGSARAERATTFHVLSVRFNDDTGSNYNFNNIFSSNNVLDDGVGSSQTSGRAGVIAAANAPTSTFAAMEVLIPSYARTDRHKTALWRSGTRYGTGANDFRHDTGHSAWQSTSAITKITLFFTTADDIAEGSVFTLYGLEEA